MDRGRYLLGDCMLLGVAVHRLTGWALVEMRDHVLVRMPDGRLLDALGPHSPDCLRGIWHRDADPEELSARFGRLASEPDVIADAHELLDSLSAMSAGEVAPFPWRPAPRCVSAADPVSCGLSPATAGTGQPRAGQP